MNRRRSLLAGLSLTVLAGCGFRLRQPPQLAFSSLQSNGNFVTPVAAELKRALQVGGTRVMGPPPPREPGGPVPEAGDVVLDVLTDQRERVVVGQTATGQIRELQLRTRFVFRLRSPEGRDLIPDTELLQTRDLSFTETAVLAKEAEEAFMYRDMQADIVQQVLRRLAAVRR